jgi:hypothetical protein
VELQQDLAGSCVVGDVVSVLGLVKVLATGDAKPQGTCCQITNLVSAANLNSGRHIYSSLVGCFIPWLLQQQQQLHSKLRYNKACVDNLSALCRPARQSQAEHQAELVPHLP